LLAVNRRVLADLAGGILGVLHLDCSGHIGGGDAELGHHVRLQPHPHGVDRVELLGIADAGNPADFLDDVGGDVVGQVKRVELALGGAYRREHQDVVGALLHQHAGTPHVVGQARFGHLDPVVDGDQGGVGVGAHLEGGGDGDRAVGGALGVVIEQAFNARELFLDGGGDCLGEGLCVGARVAGGDDHRGRGDFGILGDRQRD
jgi:hypothetical protein